ncbi:hypothetical protein SAMN05421541_107362 [Actinoplanes philippinensis]|uniref:Uncharacterized protein n=1 Tax=Actinoplanes philippinensis TaxID=35752 RepID=A0A1I2H362_9ACTN|nr:hypothetical protein SAMN05421541_107362 [Actinoplanes philippinensis]
MSGRRARPGAGYTLSTNTSPAQKHPVRGSPPPPRGVGDGGEPLTGPTLWSPHAPPPAVPLPPGGRRSSRSTSGWRSWRLSLCLPLPVGGPRGSVSACRSWSAVLAVQSLPAAPGRRSWRFSLCLPLLVGGPGGSVPACRSRLAVFWVEVLPVRGRFGLSRLRLAVLLSQATVVAAPSRVPGYPWLSVPLNFHTSGAWSRAAASVCWLSPVGGLLPSAVFSCRPSSPAGCLLLLAVSCWRSPATGHLPPAGCLLLSAVSFRPVGRLLSSAGSSCRVFVACVDSAGRLPRWLPSGGLAC